MTFIGFDGFGELLPEWHTHTHYQIRPEVDAGDTDTLAAHCWAPLLIGFSQLVRRSCLNGSTQRTIAHRTGDRTLSLSATYRYAMRRGCRFMFIGTLFEGRCMRAQPRCIVVRRILGVPLVTSIYMYSCINFSSVWSTILQRLIDPWPLTPK
jgi:hypothetical protein